MATGVVPMAPGPTAAAPYYPVRSPLLVPVIAGTATQPMDQIVPPTPAVERALATMPPGLEAATKPVKGVSAWTA